MLGAIAAHYVDTPPVAASYFDAVMADNPLAYYRLGEASGGTMLDSSGNDRHGIHTLISTKYGQPSLIESDPSNAAVLYDNNAEGSASPAESWVNQGTFTAECWIKTSIGGARPLLNRDIQFGTRVWLFDIVAGNTLRFVVVAGAVPVLSGPTPINDGAAHHCAVTYNGTTATIYLDGEIEAQQALNQALPSATTRLNIGFTNRSISGTFGGVIDEVAYYGQVLSPARVAAHYAAGIGA